MNKSTVKVIEVREAPAIGKPQMMGGIRTKEAAERWASSQGYVTVYWLKSRERVYADKRERVDAQARALETKSSEMLSAVSGTTSGLHQLSESGGVREWIAIGFLFMVIVCALVYGVLLAGVQ
jgi:hypothetical protein